MFEKWIFFKKSKRQFRKQIRELNFDENMKLSSKIKHMAGNGRRMTKGDVNKLARHSGQLQIRPKMGPSAIIWC